MKIKSIRALNAANVHFFVNFIHFVVGQNRIYTNITEIIVNFWAYTYFYWFLIVQISFWIVDLDVQSCDALVYPSIGF